MNPKSFGKLFLASCVGFASLGFAVAAHAKGMDVRNLGNDTYSITREAGSAFTRDADKLKAEASEDAAKFCAAQGRILKVISLTSDVPSFGLGYAKAKIVFMSLNPGDSRLASGEAAPAVSAAPASYSAPAYAPPVQARLSAPTDDLYNALTKLDDLRKKGILTDEEFQSEKKKLLNKTN